MKSIFKRYARVGLALLVAVLLIAAFSGSAAAAGPAYVTVQPGQTLYSIANAYGVSVWSMACANGLYNPNYIYAGMVLYIPHGWYGNCRPAYTPYQVGYHNPYPPQPYPPHPYQQPYQQSYQWPYHQPYLQPTYNCFYRVRWGDSLSNIAWRYGTSDSALASANGLANPNFIYAGMVLRIPYCN